MAKSTKPSIRIHNSQTDEIIDREMTDDEYAAHKLFVKESEENRKAQEKADADRASAASSAAAKLAALGLTPDEIAALRG